MDARDLAEIQRELEEAVDRRAALWKHLSTSHDPDTAAQVERLSELIEALWAEARAARTRARFGPKDEIIARARADERLERQYPKVA